MPNSSKLRYDIPHFYVESQGYKKETTESQDLKRKSWDSVVTGITARFLRWIRSFIEFIKRYQ